MYTEKTTNGIEYTDSIASCNGASFILYTKVGDTIKMIAEAKRELRNNRDVVSIRVANPQEWNERYRTEIYRQPALSHLRWYEINADDQELLTAERLKGTSPAEYVEQFVLPFTAETKARNLKRFGERILNY